MGDCYVSGTRLACPGGTVAVEEVRRGDRLSLYHGGSAEVIWVGRQTIDIGYRGETKHVDPIRVRAGAFADGQPARDLMVSPQHALLIDDVLIPMVSLENGATIVTERPARVVYWHVELPRHDLIIAEGMASETYLETGGRGSFDGELPPPPAPPHFAERQWEAFGCAPLHRSGPVVARVRARLEARARALGYCLTDVPEAWGMVDGAVTPARVEADRVCFSIPASAREVLLLCRAIVPSRLTDAGGVADDRTLGMAVRGVSLSGADGRMDLPLEALSGAYPVERDGASAWRWIGPRTLVALPAGGAARELSLMVSRVMPRWAPPDTTIKPG